MAEELKFYYSLNETIPTEKKNGNIYFILDEDKKIGNIKVDLENQRYDIKPEYDLATIDQAGLMSPEDKKKLIPISIEKESNSDLQIEINNDDNANFNFLRDIFINDSQVLTQNSLAQVEVTTVNQGQTPEESSSIEIVPYIDENNKNKYKLKLKLALPDTFKGKKGDPGQDGIDGIDGIDGKDGQSSKIKDVFWNFSNEEDKEPSISVSKDTILNKDTNTNETTLRFDFNNLKGERGYQGQTIGLDFDFISGPPLDEGVILQDTPPEQYIDDNGIIREKYTIHVPQGKKGDTGIPFKISQTFSTITDMEEARQNAEPGDENFIPLETFVLIEGNPTVEENGSLYFRELNGTCTKISDIIPVQPVFSAETTTIDSSQDAEVIIDNGLNNSQASTPKLQFNIPRGKQWEIGELKTSINTDFGTPKVIGSWGLSGPTDNKQLDLNLDFQNMGTTTPIDIGNITTDNTFSDNPQIKIDPRLADDGITQLLDFDFKGLKGRPGDAANSFDTSNTGITAEYITDSLDPSPRAKVDAVTEDGRIQLAFKFYNLKGDMGELKGINSSGNGNAITSISLDNTHQNFINIYKDLQFATEEYSNNANNINSGTIKVSNGGTGLNNIPLNSIVIGNGNSILKTTNSKLGALYSEGNNQEPKFGILPSNAGGTGNQGVAKNAILVGNNNDPMTPISTKSGAFFATGNGYTPDFGTLPVPQGGTGSYTHQNNSVLIGKDGAALGHINSKAGAFYSTSTNAEPQFGILPVSLGGTGATTAEQVRINIGAPRAEIEINNVQPIVQPENTTDYILSFTNVVSPISGT